VYQKLCEGMDLVQMRPTGPFKTYVLDLNAQMNATLKMNNFGKKCIFLGEKTKVCGEYLV
jgi:Fe-S-cluster containining protein